jgi:hypothetical protein
MSDIVKRPDSTYPLVIKPYKLDISQYGEKTRDEMKFTISNVSQQDLELKIVACADQLFEVSLPDKIKADSDIEGTLKVRDEVLDEQFEKSFTIEVNDEETSRFTVPVRRFQRQQQPGSAVKSGQ